MFGWLFSSFADMWKGILFIACLQVLIFLIYWLSEQFLEMLGCEDLLNHLFCQKGVRVQVRTPRGDYLSSAVRTVADLKEEFPTLASRGVRLYRKDRDHRFAPQRLRDSDRLEDNDIVDVEMPERRRGPPRMKTFNEVDENGDGAVSPEEFEKFKKDYERQLQRQWQEKTSGLKEKVRRASVQLDKAQQKERVAKSKLDKAEQKASQQLLKDKMKLDKVHWWNKVFVALLLMAVVIGVVLIKHINQGKIQLGNELTSSKAKVKSLNKKIAELNKKLGDMVKKSDLGNVNAIIKECERKQNCLDLFEGVSKSKSLRTLGQQSPFCDVSNFIDPACDTLPVFLDLARSPEVESKGFIFANVEYGHGSDSHKIQKVSIQPNSSVNCQEYETNVFMKVRCGHDGIYDKHQNLNFSATSGTSYGGGDKYGHSYPTYGVGDDYPSGGEYQYSGEELYY